MAGWQGLAREGGTPSVLDWEVGMLGKHSVASPEVELLQKKLEAWM